MSTHVRTHQKISIFFSMVNAIESHTVHVHRKAFLIANGCILNFSGHYVSYSNVY